jgi:soluble lytic murein transglycosylase
LGIVCHRFLFFVLFLSSWSASAQISTLTIRSDQKLSAPRWMFDGKVQPKGSKLVHLLVQAKKAELEKNGPGCVSLIGQAQTIGKSLLEWLDLAELRCALIPDKKGKFSEPSLLKATAKVQGHLSWLKKSAVNSQTRTLFARALLQLEELELKTNRRSAWATIDKLEQVKDALSADERARMYRGAGELAFVEQNLIAAQDFISRSLLEKDSPDLRTKLESIRTSLIGKKKEDKSDKTVLDQPPPKAPTPADLGVSSQEQGYYDRMNNGISSQDYVSAIEDGMSLIAKFPGGVRAADATDKVLEIYLSIAANGDEKYRHLLQRVVRSMDSADSGRLLKWAQAAYNRGYYLNALEFAEHAYDKFGGHPDSTRALLLAGKAALAVGEYGTAEDHLEKLATRAVGSREANDALFRLGLMKFRRGKFSEAVAFFERVLALNPDGGEFEYRALYWEWRSLQNLKNDRANEYAHRLIAKYPVTYYGLRAMAEKNHNVVEFPNPKEPLEVELRLLNSEKVAWEKFLILLQAGWFEEAQSELQNLPEPQTMQERLLRARLWALAFKYDRAIGLANRAWASSPELVDEQTLRWVYPHEFEAYVKNPTEKLKMDPHWVWSLIRQESSFQTDARSSSNALGLMQLLPATAQQLADEFRLPKFKIPDSLNQPDLNIRLGTTYFYRLMNMFSGNYPLAIAAYNAGPARMRRWMSARKDLDGLEGKVTSSPDVEIWIDELPWEETSFYVKAVLRNWMIYKVLDEGRLQVADPVWKSVGPVGS